MRHLTIKLPQSNGLDLILSISAGIALPFSLAPWNIWPLSLVSLSAFFYLLSERNRHPLFLAFFFNLGLFGAGASWIQSSASSFGLSSDLGWVLTIVFILFVACLFSLPFWLLRLFRHSSQLKFTLLIVPCVWFISEWFRSWALTGFPWLYVGYGFVDGPLAGWAPIIGALGIGYIVAVSSAGFVWIVFRYESLSRIYIAALCCFLSIVWLVGSLLKSVEWTSPVGEPKLVAVLQDNVPHEKRWLPEHQAEIFENLRLLSAQYWQDVDIMVWPELAVPVFIADASEFLSEVDTLAKESNTSVVTGILDFEPTTYSVFNSVYVIGKGRGLYRKQHLVPLGEYVPFGRVGRKFFSFMDIEMSIARVGEGEVHPLWANDLRLAVVICYEVAFARLVSQSAKQSNILVVVSNDSWFGDSIGPKQHVQIAQIRALENGRDLIRSTTSGISGVINHKGEVQYIAPQFQALAFKESLQPRTGSTPYTVLSDFPLLLFSFSLLISCFLLGIRSSKLERHI